MVAVAILGHEAPTVVIGTVNVSYNVLIILYIYGRAPSSSHFSASCTAYDHSQVISAKSLF